MKIRRQAKRGLEESYFHEDGKLDSHNHEAIERLSKTEERDLQRLNAKSRAARYDSPEKETYGFRKTVKASGGGRPLSQWIKL